MTYACRNFPRPTGQGWKDDGACQHDSARDEKCSGCRWQRRDEREIPQGDGGLNAGHAAA